MTFTVPRRSSNGPSPRSLCGRAVEDPGVDESRALVGVDELIGGLRDMEVNVDAKNGDTVRVYCA